MGQKTAFACDLCGSPSVTVYGENTANAVVTCSQCRRVIGAWADYLDKVSAGNIVWNIQSADPPIKPQRPYAGQVRTGRSLRKPSTLG